jgi:hypothetical protein
MEYKSKKNLIKAALGFQVNLAQMKLEDGITIVEAEAFEPDYSIGIVTADGIVPLPVGEYTLEDGKILVVAVEGIIADVKDAMPEAPEAEAPEAPVNVTVEADTQAPQPKRVVESVSKETFFAEIEKLKVEFSAQIEELKAVKTELESLKVEKQALEVKLNSQEEGAEPIVQNPEAEVKVQGFAYGQNHPETILDNVFSKIFS